MGQYTYKARDNDGQMVTGSLEAESEQDVFKQLHAMHYTPVQVELEARHKAPAALKKVEAPKVRAQRIEVRELMFFCVNLSNMVNAGIPLMSAIDTVRAQLPNPYFADVVERVVRKISEGNSFSAAVEEHPGVFSPFFVNMLRVGEMSGTMDSVLKSLAVYMEKQENLRQQVKGALIYPSILVVVGTIVILIILTFVMPQFVETFRKSGIELPMATQILYNLSLWIKAFWWLMIPAAIGTIIGGQRLLRLPKVRAVTDRWVLKIPVVGLLVNNILLVRFTRTLGVLISAGVPLLQAMHILGDIIDNSVFSGIIEEVKSSAEKGEGIHTPLKRRPEFPRDVVHMISVGEETGRLGDMLKKVSEFYEVRVESGIRGLVVFIEPVFISIMGVCVGIMMASVILPMFDMIKTIQR